MDFYAQLLVAAIIALVAFIFGRITKSPKIICDTPEEAARKQFLRRHSEIVSSNLQQDEKFKALTSLNDAFQQVYGPSFRP